VNILNKHQIFCLLKNAAKIPNTLLTAFISFIRNDQSRRQYIIVSTSISITDNINPKKTLIIGSAHASIIIPHKGKCRENKTTTNNKATSST
jgi:hypothetical protein